MIITDTSGSHTFSVEKVSDIDKSEFGAFSAHLIYASLIQGQLTVSEGLAVVQKKIKDLEKKLTK